jgi:hypothetical protein
MYQREKHGVWKKSTTIKFVCKKINLDCMPHKEKHQKHEIWRHAMVGDFSPYV